MDLSQIVLVLVSIVFMLTGIVSTWKVTFVSVTSFLVWIMLIGVLKSIFRGFAVFVSALEKIILKIIPFVITSVIFLLGFSNVFVLNHPNPDWIQSNMTNSSSLLILQKSFIDLLGPFVNKYEEEDSSCLAITNATSSNSDAGGQTKPIYFVYGMLMTLVLQNIIIALISNVYTEEQEKSIDIFWKKRLEFVDEVYSFLAFFPSNDKLKKIISCADGWGNDIIGFDRDDFVSLYSSSFREAGWFSPLLLLARILIPTIIVLWFILGLLSLGVLWPKWMSRYVFEGKFEENKKNESFETNERNVKSLEEKAESNSAALENLEKKMEKKMDKMMAIMMELSVTNK